MRPATVVLSALMLLIGLVMIGVTLARGGGPLATGLLAGILFVASGAGRIWVERSRA